MIKVCHIITKLELGGAQQNTLYTVKHLDRKHFIPLLITGSEGILIEEANQCVDVQKYYISSFVREIHPCRDVIAFYKIWQILRQENHKDPQIPLIVHSHSSKAGIIGFTKSVAKELGSRGIRSNAIAPGFIITEMTDKLPEDVRKEWENQIPLKRGGTTDDIANACVFLGSNLSAYVTGQTLHVCGGMNT